jgi:hypothetical protein
LLPGLVMKWASSDLSVESKSKLEMQMLTNTTSKPN